MSQHVAQAGLELLTSGDLPASPSQSAGITGVSHCAQPQEIFVHSLDIDFFFNLSDTLSASLSVFSNLAVPPSTAGFHS